MSFVGTAIAIGAVVTAGVGVAKAIDGGVQARKAKKEAEKAQKEYEKNKAMFASLDTSNPYLNMENVMEDITVNQKEAQFMQQQQMQQQANIMQQMRGVAGGSGIAALAQSMAGQGALDAQKAAASIGEQERANQIATAQEAGKIQAKEREGEVYSRRLEEAKINKLIGLSRQDVAAAKAERAAAKDQMFEGIEDVGGAFTDYATKMSNYQGTGSPEGTKKTEGTDLTQAE